MASFETKDLDRAIRNFIEWLDHYGTAGHDPYDLWSTAYGKRARRLYYRFGGVVSPALLPVVLAEHLFPRAVRFRTNRKKYATSHAHLILAYLELYNSGVTGEDWVGRAKQLAEELHATKIKGYSGDCWGYPFDWENRRGTWPKNTPLITVTPYCFEAYLALHETTRDETFRDRARSIGQFALRDLKNTRRPSGAIASSYSPLDNSMIVNASAYRAFVLFSAWHNFGMIEARPVGDGLLQFVLESQHEDGSWPYAIETAGDDFVDHFHTCFVLKNLIKIQTLAADDRIFQAIESGYAYYEKELFYPDGLPRPFAKNGNRLLKYSMYDFAEAMNLGVLMRDILPRALDRALFIARETIERFQLADGHFVTSVGSAGPANKMAYIRWPQAQLFHALASVRRALS